MKSSLFFQYINAFKVTKRTNIDKSRIGVTKAYELSRAYDVDNVINMLEEMYHKTIYSATMGEIREVVNELNNYDREFFKIPN